MGSYGHYRMYRVINTPPVCLKSPRDFNTKRYKEIQCFKTAKISRNHVLKYSA